MTLTRLQEKCGCGTKPRVTPKLKAGTFRFIASDSAVDCMGDSIAASAWQLKRYRKNPTVLFNHDHDAPVARAKRVWVEADKLFAEVAFPAAGANELADEVRSKVESGLLSAMSVGVLYHEWNDRADGGRNVTKAELLELSIVAVPCNSGALRVASMKGKEAPETYAASRGHRARSPRGPKEVRGRGRPPGLRGDRNFRRRRNPPESESGPAGFREDVLGDHG